MQFLHDFLEIGGTYLIGSLVHIIGVAYLLELHDIAFVPDNCSRSQAARNGHISGLRGRNEPYLWISQHDYLFTLPEASHTFSTYVTGQSSCGLRRAFFSGGGGRVRFVMVVGSVFYRGRAGVWFIRRMA